MLGSTLQRQMSSAVSRRGKRDADAKEPDRDSPEAKKKPKSDFAIRAITSLLMIGPCPPLPCPQGKPKSPSPERSNVPFV